MNSRKIFVRGRFFDVNGILLNPTGFRNLSGLNVKIRFYGMVHRVFTRC